MGSDRSFVGRGTVARVLALIICTSVVASVPTVAGLKKFPPKKLVIYQFEDMVPPTPDLVIIASPSGNLTNPEFGTFAAFDHTLRLGFDVNSTVVGEAYGTGTIMPNFFLYLSVTFVFNTTDYAGTISVQGIKNPQGAGELAITGGSGDFRFARGYDDTITVSTVPTRYIYHNTFTIRY